MASASEPPHLLLVIQRKAAPELSLLKAQALVQPLLLQAAREGGRQAGETGREAGGEGTLAAAGT